MTKHLNLNGELDIEWVQLMLEALELGIEKEEIRLFLKGKGEI